MDCSPQGSFVLGISEARILEWVAISFSKASSPPRVQTWASCVSCIDRWILYHWATRVVLSGWCWWWGVPSVPHLLTLELSWREKSSSRTCHQDRQRQGAWPSMLAPDAVSRSASPYSLPKRLPGPHLTSEGRRGREGEQIEVFGASTNDMCHSRGRWQHTECLLCALTSAGYLTHFYLILIATLWQRSSYLHFLKWGARDLKRWVNAPRSEAWRRGLLDSVCFIFVIDSYTFRSILWGISLPLYFSLCWEGSRGMVWGCPVSKLRMWGLCSSIPQGGECQQQFTWRENDPYLLR